MKLAEAIELTEQLLDTSAPGSCDTMEGVLSQDQRDALVVLLDVARGNSVQ